MKMMWTAEIQILNEDMIVAVVVAAEVPGAHILTLDVTADVKIRHKQKAISELSQASVSKRG